MTTGDNNSTLTTFRSLPSGTVTFLFTDIEGSTRLWEQHTEAMRHALAVHDALLKEAIERHNGVVFKTVGDAFCAAFDTAAEALNAALDAHLALLRQEWAETGPIRVRMGLHTGVAEERDNDYFGPTLNRVARLQGIGHGQQTLLSQATYDLVCSTVPPNASLSDMGLHRLKDLVAPEHVWQLLHPALPSEFPPLKSQNRAATNLPHQITSFIGREKDMAEVKALMGKTRLLTLTGSGGTGKTRLSLKVAAEFVGQFPDGVWQVELAPLSAPHLVPQKVAEVLSIREAPGEPITKTLISALKSREMLLVLDNCEHLLEATAHLANALLTSCPKVRLLATSREALRIGGENIYRVPSLSVPDLREAQTPESISDYEAVRLFIERAEFVKVDFKVTPQNTSALATVCRRLDGIPLAIELAAARVRTLSLQQIESRLDNRFHLLTGGVRTALPRQQTLRALIDWSYELLNPQEKTLLCRLSVFAGGWTLEAAEQVCCGTEIEDWEVLDLLTSLTDKSLVVFEERPETGRYRLLETVRQYSRDRLNENGESDAARAKHRAYFLELAENAKPKLRGPEQAHWLQRLDEEYENLRTGLESSLDRRKAEERTNPSAPLAPSSVAAVRFCGALWRYWGTRSHLAEGQEWCERALTLQENERTTTERVEALNGAGTLAWLQGKYASAQEYHIESLEIAKTLGDRRGIAESLNGLGIAAISLGDYISARSHLEESLTLFREISDQLGIAWSLHSLGNLASGQNDYGLAYASLQESLTIYRNVGYRRGWAGALNSLGVLSANQGDAAAAEVYYREGLAQNRAIGDQWGIAVSLNNLGNVAESQGNYVAARTYFEESLAICRHIGDRSGIAVSLEAFASLTAKEGKSIKSALLWAAAETLRTEIGAPRSPSKREQHDRAIATLSQTLEQEAFAAAWEQGRSLPLDQAIITAMEESTHQLL